MTKMKNCFHCNQSVLTKKNGEYITLTDIDLSVIVFTKDGDETLYCHVECVIEMMSWVSKIMKLLAGFPKEEK